MRQNGKLRAQIERARGVGERERERWEARFNIRVSRAHTRTYLSFVLLLCPIAFFFYFLLVLLSKNYQHLLRGPGSVHFYSSMEILQYSILKKKKKKVLFGLIFLKFMNGPNTLTATAADCVICSCPILRVYIPKLPQYFLISSV